MEPFEIKKLTYEKLQEIKSHHYQKHGYFPEYLHVHPNDAEALSKEVVFEMNAGMTEEDRRQLLGMRILIRDDIDKGMFFTS